MHRTYLTFVFILLGFLGGFIQELKAEPHNFLQSERIENNALALGIDLFQRTALIPHAVMEEENSSFEEIILKGVFSARFYASIEYLAHCADYVGSSYHYFSLPALRAPPLMHI